MQLAVEAANQLKGYKVNVVSMPSCEVFDQQADDYKAKVLASSGKRMAIEAATGALWYKYVGLDGAVVSMEQFGESAPADQLFKEFGFTIENLVEQAKGLLG